MRYDWFTMVPDRAFQRSAGKLKTLEGGGGGSTTSTSTNINYSPAEAAQRAAVMTEGATTYAQTKDTLASSGYPGAHVVPFSAESIGAQNAMLQNAQAAVPTLNNINQGVNYGLTNAMDVNNNPYLQQTIQAAVRPITESYTDAGGVMSQIRAGAQEAGNAQYGGSRQGIAEGIAAGRYADAVADASSKIATAGYNTGQDTFAKTLALAPISLEAMTMPANWVSAVGAQKENLSAQQAAYAADSRYWDLNAPWMGLQNYANIVYGAGSGGTTASGTSSGGSAPRNPLMGAVGGGIAGYALGAQIGSAIAPYGAAAGAVLGALFS